ncbi:MAG: hypothetical protein ACXWQZ_18760, partial [Ktedonobacterales bacterium]
CGASMAASPHAKRPQGVPHELTRHAALGYTAPEYCLHLLRGTTPARHGNAAVGSLLPGPACRERSKTAYIQDE